MSTIRISLSICCLIISIFAFLLPERSAFAFNLDYSEYLSRYHLFKINSLKCSPRKNIFPGLIIDRDDSSCRNTNGFGIVDFSTSNYIEINSLKNEGKNGYVNGGLMPNPNMKISGKAKYVNELNNVEDCETYILANSLIKKINCENHCKTGKLNPLYEEEACSNNFIGLPSSQNQNVIFSKVAHPHQSSSLSMFSKIDTNNLQKLQNIQQSSTKF